MLLEPHEALLGEANQKILRKQLTSKKPMLECFNSNFSLLCREERSIVIPGYGWYFSALRLVGCAVLAGRAFQGLGTQGFLCNVVLVGLSL